MVSACKCLLRLWQGLPQMMDLLLPMCMVAVYNRTIGGISGQKVAI